VRKFINKSCVINVFLSTVLRHGRGGGEEEEALRRKRSFICDSRGSDTGR
jgi:hypothetical protein